MLTRLDASFDDPIRVVAVPAEGLSQGLLLENGVLSVSLEPEDAIALTLDDGTHAAATGRQVPVTWSYVVAVTIRGAVVPDAVAALQTAALERGAGQESDPVTGAAEETELMGRGRRGRRRAAGARAADPEHPAVGGEPRQHQEATSPEAAHPDADVTITAAMLERRLSQDLPVPTATPAWAVEDDATITVGAMSGMRAQDALIDTLGSTPAEQAAIATALPLAEPAADAEGARANPSDHDPSDDDATITIGALAVLQTQRGPAGETAPSAAAAVSGVEPAAASTPGASAVVPVANTAPQDDDATITATELARLLANAVPAAPQAPAPEPVSTSAVAQPAPLHPDPVPSQDTDATVSAAELARLLAKTVPPPAPAARGSQTLLHIADPEPTPRQATVHVPGANTSPRSGIPSLPGVPGEQSDRDAEVMDSTILGYIDPASLSLPTLSPAASQALPTPPVVPAANYVAPAASSGAGSGPLTGPTGITPAPAGTRPAGPRPGGGRPSASMLAAAAALAAEQSPVPEVRLPSVPFAGPGLRISDTAGTRDVGIDATLVLGRNPSVAQVRERDARAVSVYPTGGGVSHTHVSVRVQAGTILVRDLWSTNGTRVKGAGVPPFRLRDGEEVPVTPGTVVELGDGVRLEITAGGGLLGA